MLKGKNIDNETKPLVSYFVKNSGNLFLIYIDFNLRRAFIILLGFILSGISIPSLKANSRSIFPKIDSLENILYNSLNYNLSSQEKMKICLTLAQEYRGISHKKQMEYASRALISAEELGDNENIIESLILLAEAYFNMDIYEKAIEYSTRLYNIYQTNNNELEAAKALRMIANSYYSWSKFIEANDYYNRALLIFKKHQFFEGIAQTLRELGRILGHWGEYDEALSKHQEALKFFEEIGDQEGIAEVYSGMGLIYKEIGNLERAFEFFRRSLDIYESTGKTSEIVNLTLHIGDIYLQRNLFEKALEYYFKGDEIGKGLDNKKLKAITLSNIGEAYNQKGDYLLALDYQKKSIALKEEIGDKMRLAISYTEIGLIYANVQDYQKALSYLNKGLELAIELNFKYQIIKSYNYLSDVYYRLGSYQKSLEAYKKYTLTRDQVYSEESKQTMAELQARYQVERKDKENERLRHSQQLSKAQIRIQQLLIGSVLITLFILFALALVFRKRYQQNQKLNIQLSLKNKEIEDHQKNVENLNAELKEANSTKDKFFSIVAHDLKNPFNSLLVLSEILLDDYETLTDDERKQFIYQIKFSAKNTYSLLQNLLEWASSQSNKTSTVKENINLADLTSEAVTLLKPIAKNKKIIMNSDVSNEIYAYADRNMVSTVILNLLTNAVKFTPQKGLVEIRSYEKNNHVEIVVTDSGIGISDDNQKKLFRLDEKFQTDGTDKEKGTGLGLVLCKEFIEKNNGEIWVKSKEGEGSRFYFSLPKISPQ
jgi:signal transduction histidine kinase